MVSGFTAQPERNSSQMSRGVARWVMSGLFAAFAAMSAQGTGTLEEHPFMTMQTIAVEHVRIESAKSFADVRAAQDSSLCRFRHRH
jgi:hypothetical protein